MNISKYKYIFFDLDHTLWDFQKNSEETLKELIVKYNIQQSKGFNLNGFLSNFNKANFELWDLFNQDKITAEELRSFRFDKTFEGIEIDTKSIKSNFNDDYIAICPHKGNLIPEAFETLEYLYSNYYNLYILTNGFEHIQLVKLTTSNIFHFFEEVFTVKDIGAKKPNSDYFNYVLKTINAHPSQCLMVGDSLEIDVLGAMNVGIDSVWYNPQLEEASQKPTYQISTLKELISIIEK